MSQLLFPRLPQAVCLSFLQKLLHYHSYSYREIRNSKNLSCFVAWKREFPSSSPDCSTAQLCVPNIPSPLPADSRGSWGDMSHMWGYGLPHCASSLDSYSHISLAFPVMGILRSGLLQVLSSRALGPQLADTSQEKPKWTQQEGA